jgi:hypothetical protein
MLFVHTPANITELNRILVEAGIMAECYSFDTDGEGERYRLAEFQDEFGRGWHYYYAERGQRTGLITFRNEAEACAWFLECILRDPTVYARGSKPAPIKSKS